MGRLPSTVNCHTIQLLLKQLSRLTSTTLNTCTTIHIILVTNLNINYKMEMTIVDGLVEERSGSETAKKAEEKRVNLCYQI